jgi:hypothetical protein
MNSIPKPHYLSIGFTIQVLGRLGTGTIIETLERWSTLTDRNDNFVWIAEMVLVIDGTIEFEDHDADSIIAEPDFPISFCCHRGNLFLFSSRRSDGSYYSTR